MAADDPWTWDRVTKAYRRLDTVTSRWALRWMLPVLAFLFALLTVLSAPDLVAAWNGDGTPGVFTAARQDCQGKVVPLCTWVGSFTSDNRRIHADEVEYSGPGIHGVGDQARALAVTDDPAEVYARGDRTLLWLVPVGLVSLGYLGWWVRRRGWRR